MTDHISLQSGTELVGDYRIDRVLGAGGFGITYLAQELALDRHVTIKEYFPSDFAARADGSEAVPKSLDCSGDYRWGLDRFIEEAQTLARFDHPNIVRVYRYFRANNTGYMVLHFEEGQSLKGWLKGLRRAPRQKELDTIVPQLLDALELIHQADFLHRDIAPDNIMIRKDGQPVLIDFGSARGEIASHSKTVSALVKPGYSPYEQYAETSSKQGPWTDIYALGATLYHAVTGKRPPDAPSRMVADEIVPARDAAIGGFRNGFLNAIDAALKLNIEDRPQSVAAWRRKLMAPDPVRRTWLGKPAPALKKKSDAPEPDADSPAPKAQDAPKSSSPPRAGGLIEFLDGLKSKPISPKKDSKAPAAARDNKEKAKPGKTPAQAKAERDSAAPQKPPKRSAGKRTGWGLSSMLNRIKTTPNPIKLRKAKSKGAQVAQRVPDPKPPRPRRVAKRRHASVRQVLFKLVFGIGAATAAVVMQDRFPWPGGASSSALTTASISRRTADNEQPAPPLERLERAFSGHTNAIRATAFANGGRTLLTAGEDGSLKIWDAATGAPERTIILPDGQALDIAALSDRFLTSHRNGTIALWNLDNGTQLETFKRNDAQVWSVAFIGDGGKFAAASHDWKIAVWDLDAPQQPVHIFEGHKSAAQAVDYAETPRGPVIATGSADKTVKLWDGKTFKLIRTYRGHRDFVDQIAFSPDGRFFASASIDGNIRIWSTRRRKLYRSFRRPAGHVSGLAFSRDGQTLVAASKETNIQLWDVKRRASSKTLVTKSGRITALAFAPGQDRLAASNSDGQIELWSLGQSEKISAN